MKDTGLIGEVLEAYERPGPGCDERPTHACSRTAEGIERRGKVAIPLAGTPPPGGSTAG